MSPSPLPRHRRQHVDPLGFDRFADPSGDHHGDLGTELSAVRSTLWAAIRWLTILSVTSLALDNIRLAGHVSAAAHLLVVMSICVALVPATVRVPLPWVSVAGLALAVAATTLSTAPERRANASTAIFILTYFGVLLLDRRRGLAWIAVCMGMWAVSAPRASIPVYFGDVNVNLRWFALSQLGFSALGLWWVWEREVRAAAERDRTAAAFERDRLHAIQLQERVRVSRELLVRTHETVLNDIRYVLTTDTLNRERLAEQLREREVEIAPMPVWPSVESVTRTVAESEGVRSTLAVSGGRTDLSEREADALTAAMREIVRNATRHAGATRVDVSIRSDGAGIAVWLRHDRTRNATIGAPGIGRGLVINESLAAVGGTAHLVPDGADIVLPRAELGDQGAEFVTSDVGRVGLSAVTAGNALGGLPFSFALAIGRHDAVSLIAVLASAVATALACTAAIRRRLSGAGVLAAAVAAASATALVTRTAQQCTWTEASVIIATLAGFAVTSAVVWAPSKRWWVLGSMWVAPMVWLAASLPTSCAGTTGASLRAAALPLAFLGLMSWSLRRTALRAQQTQAVRRRQVAELAAAAAALEVSEQLQSSVGEAAAIMRSVADGGPLDHSTRLRLRCLDASIRAAIQVDPNLAGGVSLAARDLVNRAVERGVPVRVLTLRDSGDRRPVDPAIVTRMAHLLEASIEGHAVLQVLPSLRDDLMIITTTPAAVQRSGLEVPIEHTIGPDEFTLDAADDPDVAVAFLRRSR